VVYTLQQQARVEPGFTQLVWQKLEEQNPDFFKAYYTRLKLKDQIVLFNHLLEQQVAMFQKMQRQWMAPAGDPHSRGGVSMVTQRVFYSKELVISCIRLQCLLHNSHGFHRGPGKE